jgi:hypothetical protein
MTVTVQLGKHTGIPVVPQKHARLRHRLSADDLQSILSKDYGPEAYRVLCVVVPALATAMPEWEFDGYASEEAARDGNYEEDADDSPTVAQIFEAFNQVIQVNTGGHLGKLTSILQLGQRAVSFQAGQEQQMPPSQGSVGSNGASTSIPTGASSPT